MFLWCFISLDLVFKSLYYNWFNKDSHIFNEIKNYFDTYLQFDSWYKLEFVFSWIYVISNWFLILYFDEDHILDLNEIIFLSYYNV